MTACDVLIIGAGPAGTTCALRLARAGWSVCLVERQSFPRRKVCGECLAPSNWPLLDALDVGTAVRRLAGPSLQEVAVAWDTHAVAAPLPALTVDTGAAMATPQFGHAVARSALDPLLLAAARQAGVRVLQPAVARAVTPRGVSFECEIATAADSQQIRTRIVVDAHGSWQKAPPLPVDAPALASPRPSDLLAFKTSFRHTALAPGRLWVLALEGGYGGMVLGADGITTVACCVRRDRLAALRNLAPGVAAGELVRGAVLDRCASARDALADAMQLEPWLAAGPLQPGVRVDSRHPSIYRVGNAAGEAHPILGEGLSMALQSGWLLAEHLIAQRLLALGTVADPQVQRAYATAWRKHFGRRVRLAAMLAQIAMRPSLCAAALPLLRARPSLLTRLARLGGKAHSDVVPAPAAQRSTERRACLPVPATKGHQ